MYRNLRFLTVALALGLIWACSASSSETDVGPSGDALEDTSVADGAVLDTMADQDVGPQPTPLKSDMFEAVLGDLMTNVAFTDGDWAEDFGDAAYYGPAILMQLEGEQYGSLTTMSLERALRLVTQSKQDPGFMLQNLEEVAMAGLALIEAGPSSETYREAAHELVDYLNQFAKGLGYYVTADITNYALDTYGPTSIAGLLALVDLQCAYVLDDERRADRVATAREIIAVIDEKAWDETLRAYRFAPDNTDLYLYPNITMTLVLGRMHQLTAEETFLQRAELIVATIGSLKLEELGCYRSPYSAEYMGAQTEVYSTLSSQNYTMLALSILFEITREDKYMDDALVVLDFVEEYLFTGSRVLHHWMDGKIAQPGDPEYYCSGCNFQLLYVVWRLRGLLSP